MDLIIHIWRFSGQNEQKALITRKEHSFLTNIDYDH